MTAAERVARGVALLDEKRPGWAAEIDLSVLDMDDSRLCICGQLWGSYGRGVNILGIAGDGFEYGFDAAELDELWIAEIRRRLETT